MRARRDRPSVHATRPSPNVRDMPETFERGPRSRRLCHGRPRGDCGIGEADKGGRIRWKGPFDVGRPGVGPADFVRVQFAQDGAEGQAVSGSLRAGRRAPSRAAASDMALGPFHPPRPVTTLRTQCFSGPPTRLRQMPGAAGTGCCPVIDTHSDHRGTPKETSRASRGECSDSLRSRVHIVSVEVTGVGRMSTG